MNTCFWWMAVVLVAFFGFTVGAALQAGYWWVSILLVGAAAVMFIVLFQHRKG